ncbi:V-type ATP synthase subunit E [Borrelia recurrentis]|uniref:V-type proton ATPase subunit E n=2 Tax=Borrelia TaxID=138 RepID=VATE_BORRA|nr:MULTISPECIES: V-type ATP synthase subunit E [Borrelia]B5RQS4.1 RecName: Full=V-type proton ATPase subunit E; AltName: Full=V-ATPase subunit E [Borrelia recurrentis A1]ACH94358.1 V-type ATPase, subunit E [Borrelia recurrentis A1]AHH06165.1 V-type ATP synthase subunit E [Borrelia crocidurae DOU]
MQFEVKDLINKIKKDGLDEAERLASEIILNAKQEAEAIILKAESEAKELKIKAEKEAYDYKRYSLEASRQAFRDLVIGTENSIKSLFKSALKDSVSSVYDSNFLRELIIRVLDVWGKDDKIDIMLNESDIDNLSSILKTSIRNKFGAEIEIKPFKGINKGFKVQQRDGSLYYDFTSEAIADILFEYLNPRFKEIIKLD